MNANKFWLNKIYFDIMTKMRYKKMSYWIQILIYVLISWFF